MKMIVLYCTVEQFGTLPSTIFRPLCKSGSTREEWAGWKLTEAYFVARTASTLASKDGARVDEPSPAHTVESNPPRTWEHSKEQEHPYD